MRKITLAHGSGGSSMQDLIRDLFIKNLGNPLLNKLGDSALIDIGDKKLAYTTDSYVINPIFFPGGDIGKLSVCGTVNDLAVCGARPRYLSLGIIVEEGLDYHDLERIVLSIRYTCSKAGVNIVTGDFKVVEKGGVDKIFINTAGIGEILKGSRLSRNYIKPGDKIIVNGTIGDHAAAIVMARGELRFKSRLFSDCAPLNSLVSSIMCRGIRFMRDPTRGGLATTLNEITPSSGYNIRIDESEVPVKESVRALCEILGFDPLYMANEGKLVAVVSSRVASKILSLMKAHPLGRNSKIIGEVEEANDKRVYLKTRIGGTRILDVMRGEQLPRIC